MNGHVIGERIVIMLLRGKQMTTSFWTGDGRLAVITAGLLGCLAFPPASVAGEWETAVETVKNATDEEILAELQRRQDARRALEQALPGQPRSAREAAQPSPSETASTRDTVTTRNTPTGLAALKDSELLDVLRLNSRAIYGNDDRRDWHQMTDPAVRRLASATVALFLSSDLQAAPSGDVTLKVSTLAEYQGLCPGEPFAEQVAGAYCSGTLVRPDVVLTAGHCLREISANNDLPRLDDIRFLFGYRVEAPGASGPKTLSADQVYKASQILDGQFIQGRDRDWALVKLDRPVPERIARPVTAWRKTAVAKGQRVFVIGYPSGLPMKYAPGANVMNAANPVYFVATLDTFGGNSGSGVFDQSTRELVGVLARGDTDYVKDAAKNCMRTYICPKSGCSGEEVTRISLVPAP
jgi:V8-like Glu-specific endopeptidase